jgi:hypothetical protein
MKFESKFNIGDPILFKPSTNGLPMVDGHVRAVHFSTGKVRYDLKIEDINSTIFNVDSIFVIPKEDGTKVSFDFDNYA